MRRIFENLFAGGRIPEANAVAALPAKVLPSGEKTSARSGADIPGVDTVPSRSWHRRQRLRFPPPNTCHQGQRRRWQSLGEKNPAAARGLRAPNGEPLHRRVRVPQSDAPIGFAASNHLLSGEDTLVEFGEKFRFGQPPKLFSLAAFRKQIVLSSFAVARSLPSGEKTKEEIRLLESLNRKISFREAMSQRRTVSSTPTHTSRRPSGEKATDQPEACGRGKARTSLPVAVSHR